jgi:hypothetical protein
MTITGRMEICRSRICHQLEIVGIFVLSEKTKRMASPIMTIFCLHSCYRDPKHFLKPRLFQDKKIVKDPIITQTNCVRTDRL